MTQRTAVTIFTDGACSPNPGIGGWAAILTMPSNGGEKVLMGAEQDTTNNRMELRACIEALAALTRPCDVTIYTDSRYVANAFVLNWIKGWIAKNWFEVKNVDLWKQLIAQVARHHVTWEWVRGHNEHPENERCDQLAVQARMNLAEKIGGSQTKRNSEPVGLKKRVYLGHWKHVKDNKGPFGNGRRS